jgi:hypothetical protein
VPAGGRSKEGALMSRTCVGFYPRERFGPTAKGLEALFADTTEPFDLVVVDCGLPQRIRAEVDRVLRGRRNAEIVEIDHFLLPAASRTLIADRTDADFVALVDNDVLVRQGWLRFLIEACEQESAAVAVPLILESKLGREAVHREDRQGVVRSVAGPDGEQLEILPHPIPKEQDRGPGRHRLGVGEVHCLVFQGDFLRRVKPFDPPLNRKEELHFSLKTREAGGAIVFEPRAVVQFVPPFILEPDDVEFFRHKWDVDACVRDCEWIRRRWRLINEFADVAFVRDRARIAQLADVNALLRRVVRDGELLVLADGGEWIGTPLTEGLRVLPFTEKDGLYWGPPADEAAAVAEMERLRALGASHVAFTWRTFWQLEHYGALRRTLERDAHLAWSSDILKIFTWDNAEA